MGRITETRKLYKETLYEITKTEENWLSFLDSSSWNFKYDFADQILIYAQRPDATACADITTWNNKVRRWVNKNANGIFIFDNDENSKYPFKLVFDVSDTHNYKGTPYKLWSVEEKYKQDIIETLDTTFGAESENSELSTSITLNAYNMVTDNIQDYMSSIKKYIKETQFEQYTDDELYSLFVPCIWASVSYMMMTRCGINAREKIDIKEFEYIKYFNSENLITILGQAVSDIAEMGLREIAKTIKNLQIEEKNKNHTFVKNQNSNYTNDKEKIEGGIDYGENNIHENGRLQYTKSSDGERKNSRWEIRKNETTLSKNTEESRIHNISDEQRISFTPITNTRPSNENDKTDNGENGDTRWNKRRIEDERPNEMDRANEQLQDDSRRTNNERIDFQLGEWTDENDNILSFSDDYTIISIIKNAPKVKLNEEKIVEFLNNNVEDNQKTREFLLETFGKEYNEFTINDDRVGYKLYNNGIYLWKGNYLNRTEKCFLQWNNFVEYCISYAQTNKINDVFEIPTENEQKQNIADVQNTPAFFVPQEVIDNDLQGGSGFQDGKFRIYQQFLKGETNIKNADFLKSEYGVGGHSIEIGNLYQNHDSKGIAFEESKTNKKYLLKWTQVAKRISELISTDRYLSEQEKDEYNDWLDANGIHHNPKEDALNDEDYELADKIHSFIKDYDLYSYLDNSPTGNTEQDNIELIRADIEDEINIKNYIDFFKTTIEEFESDDEMLPEAKELLNELEKRLPYYEFKVGNIVYIGIDEYEITSISDTIVKLADTKFPLFIKEMSRKEFDKKIKENPANDKLRTGKKLLDIEKENIKNDSEEVKQENIPIKDNEEKTLKANIKQKRRNRIEYFDLHPEIPLDDKRIQKLKDIFWEMNTISYRVESVEKDIEVIDDSGNTHTEKAIRKVLYIDIQGKSVEEMSNIYNFSENQLQQIAELRSDKYKDLWSNVLYGSSGGNTNIVEVASSQLGNVGGQPYWSWYGFNSRVSWCACFVSWCANECGYIDIGIIPKFANCQNEGIVWFKTCGLWQDNGYIPKSRRNNIF